MAILRLSLGDGELQADRETAADGQNSCNLFEAHRYLRISNACCVSHSSCSASWDLYEVELFHRSSGALQQLSPTVMSSSGDGKGRTAELAVNGNLVDFWEGDYDVGLSCSCWDESKVGGQWMILDLGQPTSVSQIRIHQGGFADAFAVTQVLVECSTSASFLNAKGLRFEVSKSITTLECTSGGCDITLCTGGSCNFTAACAGGVAAAQGSTTYCLLLLSFLLASSIG